MTGPASDRPVGRRALLGAVGVVLATGGCRTGDPVPSAPGSSDPVTSPSRSTGGAVSSTAAPSSGGPSPFGPPAGGTPTSAVPSPPERVGAPPTDVATAALPQATTFGVVRGAPRAPGAPARPTGVVLHPQADTVVWSAPGGRPLALLPAHQLGSPTWVPVVGTGGGWSQVLLPSRPNSSSGWVFTDTDGFDLARSDGLVEVDLDQARVTIRRAGSRVGSWPAVVGAPATPTPPGTTFVMASVDDPGNAYSTHLLPLGWHSDTLDTFGGGPGTVALHGWPSRSLFRSAHRALSHGCVRIPADALAVAVRLPLGTPVVLS